MPSLKSLVVALCLVAFGLHEADAFAQSTNCGTDPNCSAASTSLVLTIAVPITVAGLVIALIWNLSTRAPMEYRRAAELYLRQNNLELAQDLATGQGPMVTELASALEVRRDHLPAFAQLLRTHRSELRELSNPDQLNPDRAESFFKRLVELAGTDNVLKADLAAARVRHPQPT